MGGRRKLEHDRRRVNRTESICDSAAALLSKPFLRIHREKKTLGLEPRRSPDANGSACTADGFGDLGVKSVLHSVQSVVVSQRFRSDFLRIFLAASTDILIIQLARHHTDGPTLMRCAAFRLRTHRHRMRKHPFYSSVISKVARACSCRLQFSLSQFVIVWRDVNPNEKCDGVSGRV